MTISTYYYVSKAATINELEITEGLAKVTYTLDTGEVRTLQTKDRNRIAKLRQEASDVNNGSTGVVVEAISKKNGKSFLFTVNYFTYS